MDVLIIGAGLAGLVCARILQAHGREVLLIDASDEVGGRVRSDTLNGYTLDRGFQVLFTAYPAVQRRLDLARLDLRRFDPGALICLDGSRHVLSDPLRDPPAALPALLTPIVNPLDKLLTLALSLELRSSTIEQLLAGTDRSSYDFLRTRGFSKQIIERFFQPFYGGIFLDRSLQTSAKCLRFDFKMLSEGDTCIPAAGMGAISRQLAEPLLAAGRVRLNMPVVALLTEGEQVRGARLADGSEIHADTTVLAVPAPEAARLSGLRMPAGALGVTCLYLAGDQPVYRGKKILLNAAADALVNNAQQLSNIAPEYAPPGRHLLSAVVLGVPGLDDSELSMRVLAELRLMFSADRLAQRALESYHTLRIYRIPYAQFPQPPGLHPELPENATTRPGLYLAGELTEASSLNAAMISGEKCAALLLGAADSTAI